MKDFQKILPAQKWLNLIYIEHSVKEAMKVRSCCTDLISVASSERILLPQRSNPKPKQSSKMAHIMRKQRPSSTFVFIVSSHSGEIDDTDDTSGLQHLKRMARTWGYRFSARLFFSTNLGCYLGERNSLSDEAEHITKRESRKS